MSWVLGSFRATLGIDATGFERGMLNAQGLTQVFGSTFATFVTNPVLGGVAAFSQLTRATLSAANAHLQYVQDTRRVAQETGVSVELLQALYETLEANGVAGSRAGEGLAFLNKQLGDARTIGGPAKDTLEALGLSIESLERGEQGVTRVLEAVAAVEDPTLRAAFAADLLGRQGGAVLANQLRQGGGSVRALVADIDSLGQIVDTETIDSLNRLKDVQGRIEQQWIGLKRTAITEFLRGFTDEANLSVKGSDALAKSLRDELSPAMRGAGRDAAGLLSTVVELLKLVNDLKGGITSLGESLGVIDAIAAGIGYFDREGGSPIDRDLNALPFQPYERRRPRPRGAAR